MATATNVTFLTAALYLLDLAIKVVALGLVPDGRRPSSASACASRLRCSSSLVANDHVRQSKRFEQREVEERAHMRNAPIGQGEHL